MLNQARTLELFNILDNLQGVESWAIREAGTAGQDEVNSASVIGVTIVVYLPPGFSDYLQAGGQLVGASALQQLRDAVMPYVTYFSLKGRRGRIEATLYVSMELYCYALLLKRPWACT